MTISGTTKTGSSKEGHSINRTITEGNCVEQGTE